MISGLKSMSAGNSSTSQPQTGSRPKPRIESLSDLIFGLALSVGAITLVGNINNIKTSGDLLNDIIVFGYSFLILIVVWMRYTKIMSVLPFERPRTISLNVALLFTVSLEPFLFNVLQLGSPDIKDAASQFYAVDLGVMLAILASFTFALADEERKLVPKDSIREFKIEGITMAIAALIFFISTLGVFWTNQTNGEHWRFYIWIIPFTLSVIRRRGKSMIDRIKKARAPENTPRDQH
jgi:uncharacterized membrane protein